MWSSDLKQGIEHFLSSLLAVKQDIAVAIFARCMCLCALFPASVGIYQGHKCHLNLFFSGRLKVKVTLKGVVN